MFGNVPDWIEDEDLDNPVMWEITEYHCHWCEWTLVARTTFDEDIQPVIDTHMKRHGEDLVEQVVMDFMLRHTIQD